MSTLFNVEDFSTTAVGDQATDTEGTEDPAYITPPIRHQKDDPAIATPKDVEELQIAEETARKNSRYIRKAFSDFPEFEEVVAALMSVVYSQNPTELRKSMTELVNAVNEIDNLFIDHPRYHYMTSKEHTEIVFNLYWAIVSGLKARGYFPEGNHLEPRPPTTSDKQQSITGDGDRPKDKLCIHGGYIEEKTIKDKKGNTRVYLYERWREDGKLRSKYIGRKKAGLSPR